MKAALERSLQWERRQTQVEKFDSTPIHWFMSHTTEMWHIGGQLTSSLANRRIARRAFSIAATRDATHGPDSGKSQYLLASLTSFWSLQRRGNERHPNCLLCFLRTRGSQLGAHKRCLAIKKASEVEEKTGHFYVHPIEGLSLSSNWGATLHSSADAQHPNVWREASGVPLQLIYVAVVDVPSRPSLPDASATLVVQ